MTHRNTAGKMAVRLNIIRADQEPEQMLEHNGAPWPNNYFTLVWTDTDQVCLYVHDEVTKGGVLLACSNQASPDFCITGITLSEDNVLTIQQEGDCPDQSIDLSRFIQSLAEYTVVEGPPGFFTFRKDGVAIESWWQGGFSVVNEDGSITITNPDGSTVTVLGLPDRWRDESRLLATGRHHQRGYCPRGAHRHEAGWFADHVVGHRPHHGCQHRRSCPDLDDQEPGWRPDHDPVW